MKKMWMEFPHRSRAVIEIDEEFFTNLAKGRVEMFVAFQPDKTAMGKGGYMRVITYKPSEVWFMYQGPLDKGAYFREWSLPVTE